MRLISLNLGLPRLVLDNQGEPVSTGIFKEPVAGRVMLRTLNLVGDRQADLSVHGGASKAVYCYPSEHYEFWKRELPGMDLPWGMFGENFTIEGLLETEAGIGDTFRIGAATVMVTEPRMPCYKLGIKFGRTDIIKRFLQSERSGFYVAVLKEGEVGAGDQIELIERGSFGVNVSDITRLYARDGDKENVAVLRRLLAIEALPDKWRDRFQKQLETLERLSSSQSDD
jgi:MOSC domain-containing protein YiiM